MFWALRSTAHSVQIRRFVGGLHAASDYQFSNNFVLGLEGDIDYSDISQSETFDVFGDDVTAEANSGGRAPYGRAQDMPLTALCLM